jgi:hypothetical protein
MSLGVSISVDELLAHQDCGRINPFGFAWNGYFQNRKKFIMIQSASRRIDDVSKRQDGKWHLISVLSSVAEPLRTSGTYRTTLTPGNQKP